MTDRYPAWIRAPQLDLKLLVTLRTITEGRVSRSGVLLVAGISQPPLTASLMMMSWPTWKCFMALNQSFGMRLTVSTISR